MLPKIAVDLEKNPDILHPVSLPHPNELRLAAMQDVEIVDIMHQTTAYAARLVRQHIWRNSRDGIVPDCMSPMDLAQMAVEKVLLGAKWDADKPLWLVLQGLVQGWVGNLAKKTENRRLQNSEDLVESNQDGSRISPIDALTSSEPNPADKLSQEEDDTFILEFIDELEPGSHERLITEAIFSGASKRAEVLAETGLTAPKFEAAKKRLRRVLENYRQKRASAHH